MTATHKTCYVAREERNGNANTCMFFYVFEAAVNVMVLQERKHICRKDDACLLMIRLNRSKAHISEE